MMGAITPTVSLPVRAVALRGRAALPAAIAQRFLPGPEAGDGHPVGAGALAAAVGEEAERVLLGEVVRRDRHVARVGAARRPGPPEEVAPDTALVRDEVDAEIGAERRATRRAPRPSASRGSGSRAAASRGDSAVW